ncbi:MAG: N-acetyl-gamma-glutamyl-phosphate reductase [Alkalinema sp. CACIAM 70d]|uniref:N-acetyl-gamma-glutamyl-phosphate reductase n=1 Tax=Alkalinema sp. FACHB-956 TaxID=2692768 RepID=UPI000B62C569|nr:N-acetyl-gamma-glutamyl-phosphate reductase [Alkalinema sp. FACHB-956]MBD2326852.1 N-acetyl-gamma-glutamyl-phosphate reductase [Alkalinema sp. FACHB-956]OUC12338.1 MAG: N-acetyl-gamma-glutamyl-phosphate reductase [Alkalinema sp. CACIAM 70d]
MGELERVPVGIVGASGYGGVQLVRLLQDHPHLELTYVAGNSTVGQEFSELYPYLSNIVHQKIEAYDVDVIADRCRIVFLALPNGLAYKMAPELLARGCKVLDLSADYRFTDLATYKTWYGMERTDGEINEQAVYGLPELYRDQIAESNLIGCPGCYPTASLLALAPLLKQGLVVPETAIIDAKSGTSGGGRHAKVNMLLAEADNAIAPYGVARHRHTPEIEQVCSDLAGREVLVQFTPHLVPMVRGILATVYATLRDPGLVREDLLTIYGAFYRNRPWVKLLPAGTYPQTKWACGTNLCYISIEVDPRTDRVIVMSVIDNLLKGQAGQAIQCVNIMMGWEETLGLPKLAFYP